MEPNENPEHLYRDRNSLPSPGAGLLVGVENVYHCLQEHSSDIPESLSLAPWKDTFIKALQQIDFFSTVDMQWNGKTFKLKSEVIGI